MLDNKSVIYITKKILDDNLIIEGRIKDNRGNIILNEEQKKIEDFNFHKYAKNNMITIEIYIEDLYDIYNNKIYNKFDWAKLLNTITNQGYNVTLNINHQHGNSFNLIDYIYKDNAKIQNKSKININIRNGKMHNDRFSYNEYEQIDKVFDLCAKDIKSQGLSPLEQVIAAYKVTIGIYGAEQSNGDNSYDLTSSLVHFPNMKPVCQSYSGFFRKLCDKMGIPCKYKSVDLINSRHATDIVTIYDPKYNINGDYLFDVTVCSSVNSVINDPGYNVKLGQNPVVPDCIGIGMDNIDKWNELAYKRKVIIPDDLKISKKGISYEILHKAELVVDKTFVKDATNPPQQAINNTKIPKNNNKSNVNSKKEPQKHTNKENKPNQVIINKPVKKSTPPVKKDYKSSIEEIKDVSRKIKNTLDKLNKRKTNNQLNSMFEQNDTTEQTETYIR